MCVATLLAIRPARWPRLLSPPANQEISFCRLVERGDSVSPPVSTVKASKLWTDVRNGLALACGAGALGAVRTKRLGFHLCSFQFQPFQETYPESKQAMRVRGNSTFNEPFDVVALTPRSTGYRTVGSGIVQGTAVFAGPSILQIASRVRLCDRIPKATGFCESATSGSPSG
jgi:hypothetical protein